MIHSQLFSDGTLPARLKQSLSFVITLRFHCRSEADVFGAMHYDFQLMASLQKFLPRWAVAFRRESDPVEASPQRIHSTGFQMQGETTSCIEYLGEVLQIVMQRLPPRDNNKACPGFSSHLGCISQIIDWVFRMSMGGPRVLGVAPGTSNHAAG